MTLLPHFLRIIDHFLEMVQFSEGNVTVDIRDVLADGLSQNSLGVILQSLKSNGCFPLKTQAQEEVFWTLPDRAFSDQDASITLEKEEINTLKLYGHKRKLLNKEQGSIIKPVALEHIARKMGETDSASRLIKILRDCNVPSYLIVYPNTKWRMLDDVFLMLATSTETADHRLLFKVLEELCHPLRFAGDTQRAQEMQDFVTDLICYDHYYFVGTIIKKVGSEKDDWIVIAMVNEGREKRKKERGQKSAEGIAAMSQLFDQYTNRADEVRAESTQAHQPQSAHPPHPINIVIHNQNVQHTQPHDSSEKAAPNMSYKFHELHVELGHHILRNTANNMTKDLTGFNYHLLRLLLAADGNLVSYQAIADAVRNDTVGKLDEKDVMDRKSAFIRMLKEQLKISGSTADRLIEGKGGYRINRMVYEQSTKAF